MSPSEFRESFEPIFQAYLDKLIKRATNIASSQKTNELIKYIKLVASNGKRVRPYMLFIGYGDTHKISKKIIPQLIGVELVHLLAIIHDDIIDKSPSRHGIKTIHSKEKDQHLGNSYALLMGDLVFNWAHESFNNGQNTPESHSLFIKLIEEVVVGETMDVEMSTRKNWSKKEIDEKTVFKTARYSFMRPTDIGVSLRENPVSPSLKKTYSQISENLGILFQIDDDLLDVFGDEKKLKKKTFQDIETCQATLISFYLIRNKSFKKYFGKPLNLAERESLKNLIVKSGTLEKINDERDRLIKDTQKLIQKIPDGEAWKVLLEKITKRDK